MGDMRTDDPLALSFAQLVRTSAKVGVLSFGVPA
jgi:hypothetical protein